MSQSTPLIPDKIARRFRDFLAQSQSGKVEFDCKDGRVMGARFTDYVSGAEPQSCAIELPSVPSL